MLPDVSRAPEAGDHRGAAEPGQVTGTQAESPLVLITGGVHLDIFSSNFYSDICSSRYISHLLINQIKIYNIMLFSNFSARIIFL